MMSTPELRLFTRIIRLTLLRGIVIGLWGGLTGMGLYNFIQRFFLWKPVPFFLEGSLAAPYIMLCGAMIIFQGEVPRLYSQFLAPTRRGTLDFDNFSKYFLRLIGIFFIVIGFILLIWNLLRFPNPILSSTQQRIAPFFVVFIFVIIFLGICGISWYLSLREKHRAAQKERREKDLRESKMVRDS